MKTTSYFETAVAKNHPESVTYRTYVENALTEYEAIHTEPNGNTRRYIYVAERELYLRVVILPDGQTVHNAFFDGNYTRKQRRK